MNSTNYLTTFYYHQLMVLLTSDLRLPSVPYNFEEHFYVPLLETVTFDINNLQRRPSNDYEIIKGFSDYSFINYVSHADRSMCLPHEWLVRIDDDDAAGRRPFLKCLPGYGNGSLLIAHSIKDVAHILAPLGNVTNRSEPGSCSLVMFYKRNAPISEKTMLLFKFMPVLFPDLRVGAIDSDRFHLVNYEFGIIGVPTFMLFHEGRPFVRYSFGKSSLFHFVRQYTDALLPEKVEIMKFVEEFTNLKDNDVDWYLWLSWCFIGVCAAYYFSSSRWFLLVVEMVKRNWRESAAQHEHNQLQQ